MKQFFYTTILLVFVTSIAFADIQIGVAPGVMNFGANDDWGWCANIRSDLKFSNKFGLSFRVEHLSWDREFYNHFDKPSFTYKEQATAVYFGMNYYLTGERLHPYLNFIYGYNFGYTKSTSYQYDPETYDLSKTYYAEFPTNGPDFGLGGGVSYPLTNNLSVDLNLTYCHPMNWKSHIRCFVGLFYGF